LISVRQPINTDQQAGRTEWASVEAGFVPDPAQLRPMADALELGYDRIATMAVLCRDAWEQ